MNLKQDEELVAAREEIKILGEMVESQNLRIYDLEKELLEARQKLESID